MIDPSKSALSMLHKIGPTNRTELVSVVEGLNLTLLNSMERTGYIKRHFGDMDVVSITHAGLRRVGIVDPRIPTVRKASVLPDDDRYYKGLELRPYTGRPGCNDALALPSRHMDQLRYRDGRADTI